jgi:hypothetical protein
VDLLTEEPLSLPIAELVIADPPWYPEHYKTFITHSSRVLSDGGYLFLSVPGWLTRPSATQDRREILSTAVELGFDIAEVQAQSLQYESPDFETAVLHSAGIEVNNWRYGALFVFRKITGPSTVSTTSNEEASGAWHSFNVRGREIRVQDRVNDAEFDYAPSADSSILPSVSRRFTRRSAINVWTSRNEAFTVSNPQVVAYLLRQVLISGTEEAIEITAAKLRLNPKEKSRLCEFAQALNLHNP